MTITHKERLSRALNYRPVDRIPTQVNYTGKMGKKMAGYFGVAESDLDVFFDNHLVRVDIEHTAVASQDGKVKFDWWGAGHDASEEGYYIRVHPLASQKDLDAFDWPDPHAESLLESARKTIDRYGSEYFIVPNLGFALFERAWSLRGFEQLFVDMAEDPGFVERLFDHITGIQLALVRRFIDLGVDGGYFGDDYGAQKNLLFSPALWCRLIKPRLARLFEPFRERQLPVILHSDGQIQKILPDLLEIGVTALNPVQPEVLDHDWLRTNFAGRLAFYGGISTQTVLPNGSPQDVCEAVQACVRELAPQDSGLLLAPSHRLMSDIPMENVEAFINSSKNNLL